MVFCFSSMEFDCGPSSVSKSSFFREQVLIAVISCWNWSGIGLTAWSCSFLKCTDAVRFLRSHVMWKTSPIFKPRSNSNGGSTRVCAVIVLVWLFIVNGNVTWPRVIVVPFASCRLAAILRYGLRLSLEVKLLEIRWVGEAVSMRAAILVLLMLSSMWIKRCWLLYSGGYDVRLHWSIDE